MYEIHRSTEFDKWLTGLRDRVAIARVLARIDRLSRRNPGDAKAVGGGVSELRIDHGPGIRVYYLIDGDTVILLLCGGDKSTQRRDIERAHQLARQWRERSDGE